MTPTKRAEIKNLPASTRARLLNLAKKQNVDFGFFLKLYFIERYLYRLGRSRWRGNFALKGALIFFARASEAERPYARPTKDIDLEALALNNDLDAIAGVFKTVVIVDADDGVRFDPDSLTVERILEEDRYAGVRVHVNAYLGKARDRIQIDIGFGDAVTPEPVEIKYPTLLDTVPEPELKAYPIETVVAEKWEATISLGEINSRLKDVIDLEKLARTESFNGAGIQNAMRNTFERRNTPFDLASPALTPAYRESATRQTDYAATRKRLRRTDGPERFADAMALVLRFLEPPYRALAERREFSGDWNPKDAGWR